MATTLNAGTSTSGAAISADTSGILQLQSGSTPTTAMTIDASQVVTFANPIKGGAITSGTAQATTSGTSIDFTGIPSWVKRITVMFMGVSVSGTSIPVIKLGTSSGIESTTYLGTAGGGNAANLNSVSQMSVGFNLIDVGDAAVTFQGRIEISLGNLSTNTWCANGTLGNGNTTTCFWMGGTKSLSGTLDRIRLTTVNGTDTFDAGSVNILYE